MMMMSGSFGGVGVDPQQKSSSVDGLMLGGNHGSLVDREFQLGERNSNSLVDREFQLGEKNSNSVGLGMGGGGGEEWDAQLAQEQQRRCQRKRKREAESVQDQMERALDFLKQEAERAHLCAREQQRHQQRAQRQMQEARQRAQSARDAELAQEHQQRAQRQMQEARQRAQSARDAELAQERARLIAQVAGFLPDFLHGQSARDEELDIQEAELARAQRARLLKSRSAEFPCYMRPTRRLRALWSQRPLWSLEKVISEDLKHVLRPSREQDKDEMCTVCQDTLFDEGDKVSGGIATLLFCKHEYHKNCIKAWLLKKNACPLCKRKPILCY